MLKNQIIYFFPFKVLKIIFIKKADLKSGIPAEVLMPAPV